MRRSLRVSSHHAQKRVLLSVVGIALMVAGIALWISGSGESKAGHQAWADQVNGPPAFPGFPSRHADRTRSDAWDEMQERTDRGFTRIAFGVTLLASGLGLLLFANQGRFLRYTAGETLPVVADAAVDLAPAIRTVAGAVAEGLRAPGPPARVAHHCGTQNDSDDQFCKGCGASLVLACPACDRANDADARFCEDCGVALPARG